MRLNKQVCRNHARLPSDFYFELTLPEAANLKSQYATSSWGGRRKLPNAFTEHGAIMAARQTRVQFKQVFDALRELMAPPDPPRRSIGFVLPEEKSGTNKAVRKIRVRST